MKINWNDQFLKSLLQKTHSPEKWVALTGFPFKKYISNYFVMMILISDSNFPFLFLFSCHMLNKSGKNGSQHHKQYNIKQVYARSVM